MHKCMPRCQSTPNTNLLQVPPTDVSSVIQLYYCVKLLEVPTNYTTTLSYNHACQRAHSIEPTCRRTILEDSLRWWCISSTRWWSSCRSRSGPRWGSTEKVPGGERSRSSEDQGRVRRQKSSGSLGSEASRFLPSRKIKWQSSLFPESGNFVEKHQVFDEEEKKNSYVHELK